MESDELHPIFFPGDDSIMFATGPTDRNGLIKNPDRNYPGEFLDRLERADKYPNPEKVGEYTTSIKEYLSFPKTVAQ